MNRLENRNITVEDWTDAASLIEDVLKIQDNNSTPSRFGILLIVAATVLWSLSGFFTQLSALESWPPDTRGLNIAFWRAIFAALFLLPLIRRISWKPAMIPMALCFAAMTLTFLTALVLGSPANTIWLQYLAPVWVMLGAVWIYGDRPVRRDWLMLGCCTAGVLFILVMEAWKGESNPDRRWWAPILAICSGLTYAGVILSMRKLPEEDSAWIITLNHSATALIVGPVILLWGTTLPANGAWWILICLGVLQMGLPYFLFAQGLKTTPSHVAALISLLEPVLLPLWVHLTRWNDPNYVAPGWWTWCGATMILLGLVGRYAFQPRSTPATEASA